MATKFTVEGSLGLLLLVMLAAALLASELSAGDRGGVTERGASAVAAPLAVRQAP